ncbi:MAG: hypothetical protein RL328_551 [Acidobacteriota bacterium]
MVTAAPPHDLDAEEALLGSCLLSPAGLEAALGCSPADFYKPAHSALFEAIVGLHHAGQPVDVVTLATRCPDVPRGEILRIQASTPASANAPAYAEIVRSKALLRRAMMLAAGLRDAAAADELGEVLSRAASLESDLGHTVLTVDPGLEAQAFVDRVEPERHWLVPGLLRRRERMILTAAEGAGKSTLLRQMAVMLSAGIHPFTREEVPALRVVIVDLENDETDLQVALKKLLARCQSRYRGTLWVKPRPQGIDLSKPWDVAWLDALLAHHQADLCVFGPLYKSFSAPGSHSKDSETAAFPAAAAIDQIRIRRDCAFLIEAHAPHGASGDRADYRPLGSTLWLRWPEFGLGMKPTADGNVKLVRWRGMRDRQRQWPEVLAEGTVWPWQPLHTHGVL